MAAAAADIHLIVQLKANQPALFRRVKSACVGASPLSIVQTVDEKRRNRHETRTVAVFEAGPAVRGSEWEPLVTAVVRVERRVATFMPLTGMWKTSQ